MRPLLLWLCPSILLLASLPIIVTSCRSSSPKEPEFYLEAASDLWQPDIQNLRQPSLSDLPADLRAAFSVLLLDSPERIVGAAIPVLRGTACESWVPLPALLWSDREPRAGQLWEFQALTSHMSAPTDWPMALLAGRPGALDLSPWNYRDCWLLVDPVVTFWPGSLPTDLFYREPGSGRAVFNWTIPADWAGQVWRFQLAVWVPRDVNPGGAVLSQAVDIHVGSRP